MVIHATDRVEQVLGQNEALIDVFVAASPHFERLRNPAMRRVMARLVTVEQAARIARIPADTLVARLNAAAQQSNGHPGPSASGSAPAIDRPHQRPAAIADVRSDRILDVDVREDLRNGHEPFARIMAARRELPWGQVLRLRSIFEPAPLYQVLAKQGFAHWTEQLADDDWRVWFYRSVEFDLPTSDVTLPPENSTVATQPVPDNDDEDVLVLDVRGLEPPEPMVRTLAALETLPVGSTLVQLNVRTPRFLLPRLDDLGFEYEIREQGNDLVRLFVRHRTGRGESERGAPDTAFHNWRSTMQNTTDGPIKLDVRVIPPREKHPTIFRTFDALVSGESLVLFNDHDPFPLRYQFEAERPGEFAWEYLESGPVVWRVEISRR
jgi:uncharacterized protein (DUF2249 family)